MAEPTDEERDFARQRDNIAWLIKFDTTCGELTNQINKFCDLFDEMRIRVSDLPPGHIGLAPDRIVALTQAGQRLRHRMPA